MKVHVGSGLIFFLIFFVPDHSSSLHGCFLLYFKIDKKKKRNHLLPQFISCFLLSIQPLSHEVCHGVKVQGLMCSHGNGSFPLLFGRFVRHVCTHISIDLLIWWGPLPLWSLTPTITLSSWSHSFFLSLPIQFSSMTLWWLTWHYYYFF